MHIHKKHLTQHHFLHYKCTPTYTFSPPPPTSTLSSYIAQHHITIYITNSSNHSPNTTTNPSLPQLYPNPASEYLQIDAPYAIEVVEIYNTLGERVAYQMNKDAKQMQVSLSGMDPAVYLLRLQTAQGFFTKKFRVQKE